MTVGLYFIEVSDKNYLMGLGVITLIATILIVFIIVKTLKHPFPKLAKYVKNSHKKGTSMGELRSSLVDAGWPEHVVDYELKRFSK